jgi:hypothetical protein
MDCIFGWFRALVHSILGLFPPPQSNDVLVIMTWQVGPLNRTAAFASIPESSSVPLQLVLPEPSEFFPKQPSSAAAPLYKRAPLSYGIHAARIHKQHRHCETEQVN